MMSPASIEDATDSNALRDRVGHKLARLVEITRIIDRNTDDGAFVRNSTDAEFFYVLDTNAVRMFFEPFQNPEYAELFHASVWGDQYVHYDRINQQSCLLIAEYMVSGEVPLPGQRNGALYMSVAHHQELLDQMEMIDGQLREKALKLTQDAAYGRAAARSILELNELKHLDAEKNRDRLIEYAVSQAVPGTADHERMALKQLSPEEFKERAALIRTRQICSLLARNRLVEPLYQLRRFRTKEIAGRFAPIEQKFRATAKEIESIEDDARSWRDYLWNVMRSRPKNSRSERAVSNDCRTLAYLTWAQKNKASRNQRLVLVTGDKALYDAYRRRHSTTEGLPFLMRPLTQYAPLFNPTDAASSVADRDAVFKSTRGAIEMATISLNLNLFGSNQPDSSTQGRIRDHFILESEKSITSAQWALKRLYPKLYDDAWLTAESEKFTKLVAPLQDIETLMLGVYPDLIAPRLKDDRKAFLEAARQGDGAALANVLLAETDKVEKSAFQVSIPFMSVQVRELLLQIRSREKKSVRRAALAVRLRFAVSSQVELGYGDVIQILLGKADKADDLQRLIEPLESEPSRVFALAALLTFSLELWDEAARYAELAANAAELATPKADSGTTADEFHEYLYLRATSLRFRIATHRPNPEQLFHDPWALWLESAREALEDCEKKHRLHGELSRRMRALSERASASLSYCAWFAFGRLGVVRVNQGINRVSRIMTEAVEDFAECHRMRADAERHVEGMQAPAAKKASGEVLAAAVRQYRVNSLAARFIAKGLASKNLITEEELETWLAKLPQEKFDYAELPTIAQAYFHARDGEIEKLHQIDTAGDALSLALDRAIIEGLKRLLPRKAVGVVPARQSP
jgi:hypothetical protein